MSSPGEFTIGLHDEPHRVNGRVQGRFVLAVEGKQRSADRVTLDSPQSVRRTAAGWAKLYDLDADEVQARLGRACINALTDDATRRKQAAERVAAAPRISTLADDFVAEMICPEWHRDGATIYSAGVGREVRIDGAWKLGIDEWVDRVGDTVEGIEGSANNKPISYRARLGLFRDAVGMAATRAVAGLPAYEDIAEDATLSQDNLLADLTEWLLKERRFTPDNGNQISTNYFSWACGLAPERAWIQCFVAPVFARLESPADDPQIAFKGETLRAHLHYPSITKLATDLRECGFAVTGKVIKVTAKSWRVWVLTDTVVGQVRGA